MCERRSEVLQNRYPVFHGRHDFSHYFKPLSNKHITCSDLQHAIFLTCVFQGHMKPITAMAVSNDKTTAFTGGQEGISILSKLCSPALFYAVGGNFVSLCIIAMFAGGRRKVGGGGLGGGEHED